MNIRLQWDQRQLETFVGRLPRRFAYASVNALRATAERIQQAEFDRARSVFAIRKQAFFFGSPGRPGGVAARITTFPSVKRGIAFAEIEGGSLPRGGDELSSYRRLLYGGFETGFERRPFTPGAKHVAVPRTGGPARPTARSPITPDLTFAKMRLQAFYKPPGRGKQRKITRQTRSRKNLGVGLTREYGRVSLPGHEKGIQWKGANRTFVVFTRKQPEGEVLQRTGRGRGAFRLAWLFERPMRQDRRLEFVATAQRVGAQYFREECERQVQDVLQHDAEKALRAAL